MSSRRVALAALAALAAGACNLILDNSPGALGIEGDAASGTSSGGPGTSSSSGGTTSSSSGSPVDAAVAPDAGASSSSSGSSSGQSGLVCPCGENDTGCDLCVPTPYSVSDGASLTSLGATATTLWATTSARVRSYTISSGDSAGVPIDAPFSMASLVTGVPALNSTTTSPWFYAVAGGEGLGGSCSPDSTTCAEHVVAGVRQILAARNGALLVAPIAGGNEPGVAVQYVTEGESPSAVFTVGETTIETAQLRLATNQTTAFLYRPNDGVPGGSILRADYGPRRARASLSSAPSISALAASEEVLFFSPCGASAGICAGPTNAADLSGFRQITPVLPTNGVTNSFHAVHADGNVLYFNWNDQAAYCNTGGGTCNPTALGTGSLTSFTRNATHLFVKVGPVIYRAQRSPLRATAP